MDTRMSQNNRMNPVNSTEAAISTVFQLRGGTSGVHARNFSDFEPQKNKNRSRGGSKKSKHKSQQWTLVLYIIKREVIDKLNYSENLVVKQFSADHYNGVISQVPNTALLNSQFMISPQQMTEQGRNQYDNIKTPPIAVTQQFSKSKLSLNNSLQSTATHQNAKAFFEINDPRFNLYQQTNQTFILSPNQIKFHQKDVNTSQIIHELSGGANQYSKQQLINNINSNQLISSSDNNNKQSPSSRNMVSQFEFQQPQQRSLSTKQSSNQSRNYINGSEQLQGIKRNTEIVESSINKNIKLEPITGGITGKYNSPSRKNVLDRENTLEDSNIQQSDLFQQQNAHIFKTADKRVDDSFLNEGGNNSSFRVENRRARPKIIKNINNICNIFIFQNSSINNSGNVSQERKKRRSNVKQNNSLNQSGTQSNTLPSRLSDVHKDTMISQINVKSKLNPQENHNSYQPPYAEISTAGDSTKDQYYFTFFKDNPNHQPLQVSQFTHDQITDRTNIENEVIATDTTAKNIQLFPPSRQQELRQDAILSAKGLPLQSFDAKMIINSVSNSNVWEISQMGKEKLSQRNPNLPRNTFLNASWMQIRLSQVRQTYLWINL
ncbi:UNKNOWN [Stylonychia lemnae]|uniref:Uncharacterized protein n=1 Tax=Stylonychia lemnae TaxID=5949 RepID=A0A078B6U8_STYLE|nr:UNKNOWN [Stylonychia lemnae]|eukprot:CDW89288.1 UNKNOWN [Stylonychia lemnae]